MYLSKIIHVDNKQQDTALSPFPFSINALLTDHYQLKQLPNFTVSSSIIPAINRNCRSMNQVRLTSF